MKITVVGGSGVYTPVLARELKNSQLPITSLVLQGRNSRKLEGVAAIYRQIAGERYQVLAETDLDHSLQGADFVICQVRVGGMEARQLVENFPLLWGVPGDETAGPGGIANFMRTWPFIRDLVFTMEEVCPKAVLVLLTNPCSMLMRALQRVSSIRCIGLCDQPYVLRNAVARLVNALPEDVGLDYFGINHLAWAKGFWQQEKDITNAVLTRASSLGPKYLPPMIRATGAIPIPYVGLYYNPSAKVRELTASSRAAFLMELEQRLVEHYQRGEYAQALAALEERDTSWYRVVVDVVQAMALNTGQEHYVNMTNNGLVPGLPSKSVVEVRAKVYQSNLAGVPVQVPEALYPLLLAVDTSENLAVEAVLNRQGEALLGALAVNPLIPSWAAALELREKLIELEGGSILPWR